MKKTCSEWDDRCKHIPKDKKKYGCRGSLVLMNHDHQCVLCQLFCPVPSPDSEGTEGTEVIASKISPSPSTCAVTPSGRPDTEGTDKKQCIFPF